MIGHLYIDDIEIGDVDLQVIDESMGGIGGEFFPNRNYEHYRIKIQSLYETNGIANVMDFNFAIIFDNNILIGHPAGGIGITDSIEFDEKYVEAAGVDRHIIEMIKSAK